MYFSLYVIPTGHLFPQPDLRFPVRSVSPFHVQGDLIVRFRRVGDLAYNTVLLMHLGAIRCTRSCLLANVCSDDTACVKSEDVKTSQSTDSAVCTNELMVPLNVGPYNTLPIVHVDAISSISSILNLSLIHI